MSPVHAGTIVVPVHANEHSLVEVRWHCRDGSIYYQRVSIPPKATREAHGVTVAAEEKAAVGPQQTCPACGRLAPTDRLTPRMDLSEFVCPDCVLLSDPFGPDNPVRVAVDPASRALHETASGPVVAPREL